MTYFVCAVPVSPMRFEPFHVSEMVSQVLFGEQCMQLKPSSGGFIKVRTLHDGYEGYCAENQFMVLNREDGERMLTADWINELRFNGVPMKVPFGSYIPSIGEVVYTGNTWDRKAHGKYAHLEMCICANILISFFVQEKHF